MTITRDWLGKAISDIEAMRDEIPFGLDEDERNTLEALRIALASLEAELVVPDYKCAWDAAVKTAELDPTILPDEFIKRVVFDLVYTGLDEQTRNDEEMLHELVNSGMLIFHNQLVMLNLTKNSTPAKPLHENSVCVRYSDINESGQSKAEPPVIPDGWVACSERMPGHSKTFLALTAFGEYWTGYFDRTDVFWCDETKVENVTHWMPLPAAPQQESE